MEAGNMSDGWSDQEEFWMNHDVVQDDLYLEPIFAEGSIYRAHNLIREFKFYVEENKDGTCTYNFVTNRYKKFPAKSPDGMFTDIKIPNNLQTVVNTIDEYYK